MKIKFVIKSLAVLVFLCLVNYGFTQQQKTAKESKPKAGKSTKSKTETTKKSTLTPEEQKVVDEKNAMLISNGVYKH